MGRALVSLVLWLLAACGALATAFFVAMLLTPGYGDVVIAVFAGLSALLTLGAGTGLRRQRRDRRARRRQVVQEVREGRLLEEVPPSRRRWTIVTLAAAVFVVCALVPSLQGSGGALVVLVLFGAVAALAGVQLVPGAAWLRITTRGIVTRNLGRTRAHLWEDVDGFRVYEVRTQHSRQRLVGWDASGDAHRLPGWLRRLNGVDGSLPTEYEGDPEELAARLQRYRDECPAMADVR